MAAELGSDHDCAKARPALTTVNTPSQTPVLDDERDSEDELPETCDEASVRSEKRHATPVFGKDSESGRSGKRSVKRHHTPEFGNQAVGFLPCSPPTRREPREEEAASSRSSSRSGSLATRREPRQHLVASSSSRSGPSPKRRDWCSRSAASAQNRATSSEAGLLTVTLAPGEVGMKIEAGTGSVKLVELGKQADRCGVLSGMRCLLVDGRPYSTKSFRSAIVGSRNYEAVFAKQEAPRCLSCFGTTTWCRGARSDCDLCGIEWDPASFGCCCTTC